MPSTTITTSAENFTRIVTAIDNAYTRADGETNAVVYKRWLKNVHRDLVCRDEGRAAEAAVVPDDAIAEVT